MTIDWQRMLPELIGAGASTAGQIYGATKQAGSIDKAAQIGAQTAQQQLNAILGMYGLARGDRAPHRAVGVSALNTLQNWRPGQQNVLSPVNLSGYKPNQVDLPPQLSAMTTGGTGNALAPQFGDISTKGIQSRGSRILGGALGGFGIGGLAGGAAKFGTSALLSPAKGALFGGPGPAIAGAAIGAIRGAFDNQNPDKSFATTGINRVSDWTWNQLVPQMKSGQITPEQAEQAFNQTWNQWEQSMRSTPQFNKDVLERSIATQRQYFQPFFAEVQRLKGAQTPAAT